MRVKLGSSFKGIAGQAREIIFDLDPQDPIDWLATISTWFIEAPGQSPAWHCYGLSAIHLRPLDRVKPAVIREPGATHEILLIAFDPSLNPDPLDPASWRFLHPLNLSEQIKLPGDAAAAHLVANCAAAVAKGALWAEPPLSGQKEPWRQFLRNWAAEYRED